MASRAVFVIMTLACLTSGCSSPTSDALQLPAGESGSLCTPSDELGRVTVGLDYLLNVGEDAITVTNVELVEARNLRIHEWKLENGTALEQVGTSLGWNANEGEWHQDPIPIGGNAHLLLLLQVEDTTRSDLASAEAAIVTFRLPEGERGQLQTAFEMAVTPNGDVVCH